MKSLKIGVTKCFNKKKVVARTLKKQMITSDADFFELAVLADLVEGSASWQPVALDVVGATRYYLVACSPTSKWLNGSRFEAFSSSGVPYALRSGLSVELPDGSTSEIDVLIFSLVNVTSTTTHVTSSDVVAGFECKAFGKRLQLPTIDAVIGKACRVWKTPVPTVPGAAASAFCLCALLDVTANAQVALVTACIDLVENMASSPTPSKSRAHSICQSLGL